MCGIAGLVGGGATGAAVVRRMLAALAHRGPDGEGLHEAAGACLGHRRLAVLDLAGGRQPVVSEDGAVVAVLNGEIANHRALAAGLAGRHRLASRGDAEVLVHLYEELGDRLLDELSGTFALLLWDARRGRLLAARDRFGERPLCWAARPGGLALASEPGALAAAGVDLGAVDRAALEDYLARLYVAAPRSIRAGVQRLPAGHALVFEGGEPAVRRWWRPPRPGGGAAPAAAAVEAAVEEAVRLHLQADVPVGLLLSGGTDSAVVAAAAVRQAPDLPAWTVAFGRPDDEVAQAQATARHLGLRLEVLRLDDDPAAHVEAAFDAAGELLGDGSLVPTLAAARAVRREVKVVLTGDGGDELFAGYDLYRRVARTPPLGPLAPVARWLGARTAGRPGRALRLAGGRGLERALALSEVFGPVERRRLLGGAAPPGPAGHPDAAGLGPGDAALAQDLAATLPDQLLLKADTAAMRVGLEARAPLLDHRLAELVVPAPLAAKQDARRGKLLLRAAFEARLPPGLFDRPKRGFGIPAGDWLRGPLRPLLWDTAGARGSPLGAWLDLAEVARVLRQVDRGGGNPYQAWALLALDAWARRHLGAAQR